MPEFDKSAKMVKMTISGVQVECPEIYAEGHQLTEGEASQMNQVLRENVRNNFNSTVKAEKEAAEKEGREVDGEKLAIEFLDYVTQYEFGITRAASPRIVDPIDKMAHDIAGELLKKHLSAQGKTITGKSGIGRQAFNELIEELLTAKPEIRQQAEILSKISLSTPAPPIETPSE